MSENEKAISDKIGKSFENILKKYSAGGDAFVYVPDLKDDVVKLQSVYKGQGRVLDADDLLNQIFVDRIVQDPKNPNLPKAMKLVRDAVKSFTADPGNPRFVEMMMMEGAGSGHEPPGGVGGADSPPQPETPEPEEAVYFKDIRPYPTWDDPTDLIYVRPPGGKALPEEETKFKRAVDDAARRIAAAFRGKRRDRAELMGLLAIAAFNGLGGPWPVLANGWDSLANVKQMTADKANALKQERMYEIALHCGFVAVGAVAFLLVYYALSGLALDYLAVAYPKVDVATNPPTLDPQRQVLENVVRHAHPFALGILGILLGFTLMGFVSNRELTFDNFDRFGIYIVSVGYYLGYLAVLFSVFYILLAFDLVEFGIGGQSFGATAAKPWIAFLIGLSVAIGEQIYSQLVVNALKPNAAPQEQKPPPAP